MSAVDAFRQHVPWPRAPRGGQFVTVGAFAGWFWSKAQENARLVGTYQAARNLRKQGVPREYALAILVGRYS